MVELTQANVQTIVLKPGTPEAYEFKAKRGHEKFPMLELEDGSMICES